MRRPKAPRPASLRTKIFGAAVTLTLMWAIIQISMTLSGQMTRSDDASPADFAASSQAGVSATANQHLADGDPAGAISLATQALARSPVSAASLRVLGLSLEKQGDWQHGNAVMGQAAALGWRDLPTQLWLASAFAQSGDYRSATYRLDAALRVHPQSPDLQKLAYSAARDPNFTHLIVDRLALEPEWRFYLLLFDPDLTADDASARYNLLLGLARTANPPSGQELAQTVNGLIRTGSWDKARALWLTLNHLPDVPLLDSQFLNVHAPEDAAPYGWTLRPVVGMTADTEKRAGVSGMALHVKTDGNSNGMILTQWLQLPPGSREFSVFGAGNRGALQTLRWDISCSPRGNPLSLISQSGSQSARFVIPAEDCARQVIMLASRPGLDSAGGDAWFWNVAVR